MLKKTFLILKNFWHSLNFKEIFDLCIIPLILTLILYFYFNSLMSIKELKVFAEEFNSMVINVTAILGAFSLATLSIIITSSNSNIELAKKTFTSREDSLNKKITYYKLQVLRNFFSLFTLFGVLIYAIIFKFLICITINFKYLFYVDLYLLLVAIIAQIFVIQSMYFLFIEPKN